MKNRDDLATRLSAAVMRLENEELAVLDFDELRGTLQEAANRLDASKEGGDELAVLREDYIARIAGMVKAIAAVNRRGSGLAETVELIERLPTLDAESLVSTYRRVTARFRDAFPASFGNLSLSPRPRPHDTLTDYK